MRSLRREGTAEGASASDDLVEIGTTVYASNVLTTVVTTAPGYPAEFTADLAPDRYFARVRRRDPTCGERPVASPEVSFEISPQ